MSEADRADFLAWMAEMGLSAEDEALAASVADVDPIPNAKVFSAPSSIHGAGTFAATSIAAGEVVGLMFDAGKASVANRYMNHSATPNVRFVALVDGLAACALHEVPAGDELTVDYRQSIPATIAWLSGGDSPPLLTVREALRAGLSRLREGACKESPPSSGSGPEPQRKAA